MSTAKRYEQLAELLAGDIRNGRLAPGTRLPSVRQLCAQHGVSASTVFQAYYRLEEKGLVRARERSGYFASAAGALAHALPETPRRAARLAGRVDVSELVFAVLGAAQQPDIVPLGSAFPAPTLFPLPRLARSLASAGRQMLPQDTVTDLPQGSAALRQQIARRYHALGMPQPAHELIVTHGALEALNLCLSAVAQPGDLVAVESPGFYASLQALERMKMKALEIPVHAQDGLDLGALAQALRQHPVKACWFMTTFQNPTGASVPEEKKQELVALLARHHIPLIEDDVYGELYYGSRAPLPAKAFDRKGLVLHCGSFSKSLAPGYRVGWVAPGRFGPRIERLKLMTTLSASLPAQAAIADYLQHGGYDRHLRRLRHALESQQAQMRDALARQLPRGVRISRPDGGYFIWLAFEPGFDTLALHQQALAQGVGIAPGPIFSARRGLNNCVRLNCGHPWDARLDDAVRTLAKLAAAQG